MPEWPNGPVLKTEIEGFRKCLKNGDQAHGCWGIATYGVPRLALKFPAFPRLFSNAFHNTNSISRQHRFHDGYRSD